MSGGVWEQEFGEARQRLLESSDFHALRSRGHDPDDAVVLTSVSDVPFEVSLKCTICGAVFWFENTEWSTGGIAKWRTSSISIEDASSVCLGWSTGCQSGR
ncbi:MAG: hypothetical protein JO166_05505 [Deltaproteobacteria bacterium]|nr:hypothetical protein [Deltaproteobacteria bacterium]